MSSLGTPPEAKSLDQPPPPIAMPLEQAMDELLALPTPQQQHMLPCASDDDAATVPVPVPCVTVELPSFYDIAARDDTLERVNKSLEEAFTDPLFYPEFAVPLGTTDPPIDSHVKDTASDLILAESGSLSYPVLSSVLAFQPVNFPVLSTATDVVDSTTAMDTSPPSASLDVSQGTSKRVSPFVVDDDYGLILTEVTSTAPGLGARDPPLVTLRPPPVSAFLALANLPTASDIYRESAPTETKLLFRPFSEEDAASSRLMASQLGLIDQPSSTPGGRDNLVLPPLDFWARRVPMPKNVPYPVKSRLSSANWKDWVEVNRA